MKKKKGCEIFALEFARSTMCQVSSTLDPHEKSINQLPFWTEGCGGVTMVHLRHDAFWVVSWRCSMVQQHVGPGSQPGLQLFPDIPLHWKTWRRRTSIFFTSVKYGALCSTQQDPPLLSSQVLLKVSSGCTPPPPRPGMGCLPCPSVAPWTGRILPMLEFPNSVARVQEPIPARATCLGGEVGRYEFGRGGATERSKPVLPCFPAVHPYKTGPGNMSDESCTRTTGGLTPPPLRMQSDTVRRRFHAFVGNPKWADRQKWPTRRNSFIFTPSSLSRHRLGCKTARVADAACQIEQRDYEAAERARKADP
ncbi:hypothetical protein LY76DRAFT_251288 [Colletotrichum caudatum]|nr:hypothetical protein LY76DRAFT_251288 [Colletotrichum caudatum]